MLAAPEGSHSNGVATLITAVEVEQMRTTNRTDCIDAVERMAASEAWLEGAKDMDVQSAVRVISELQVPRPWTTRSDSSKRANVAMPSVLGFVA